jgi:transposase
MTPRSGCGSALKRVGEGATGKLDHLPGTFMVECQVHGKWACAKCATLIQAPVPACVIDKGIPTAGLLAQVLVSKYADHAPLYPGSGCLRARAWRSRARRWARGWGACGVRLWPLVDTLQAVMSGQAVLHADETPVAMLKAGNGKTHRAYLWRHGTTQRDAMKAVAYDFAEGARRAPSPRVPGRVARRAGVQRLRRP